MNDPTRTTTALLGGPDVPTRGGPQRPPVSRPAARGSALVAVLAGLSDAKAAGKLAWSEQAPHAEAGCWLRHALQLTQSTERP